MIPTEEIRRQLKPEERLLLAVFEDALDWLRRSRSRWARAEAVSWFLSDDPRPPFSFIRICAHFNWSPASIRERLSDLLTTKKETAQ